MKASKRYLRQLRSMGFDQPGSEKWNGLTLTPEEAAEAAELLEAVKLQIRACTMRGEIEGVIKRVSSIPREQLLEPIQ